MYTCFHSNFYFGFSKIPIKLSYYNNLSNTIIAPNYINIILITSCFWIIHPY